jgi:hypothetical protein
MARRSSEQARPSMIRPYEGPLLTPRASPKLSIGDIREKAKVCYVTDRACSAYSMAAPAVVHGKSFVQRSPERRGVPNAGCDISGAFNVVQNLNCERLSG